MRYLITAVAMTRQTRRRAGKSWTQVIDTDLDAEYGEALLKAEPEDALLTVEQVFEGKQDLMSAGEVTKVIDVRELCD